MFDLETFRNPEARYGIHPFWFWNGDMEDGEIVRQIEEMARKRVGGFLICPRQGLKIPYLSEAWFQKVRLAVKKAAELGLEVWLYDEYPYPSGIAGGEVTLLHPDAKHHVLVHRTAQVQNGETCVLELPWGRLLYAKAVPIEGGTGKRAWHRAVDVRRHVGNHQAEPVFQKVGLTAYNRKRFFTYQTVKKLQWTAPDGLWEIHVFLEQEITDFKYYGTYVDPCNEEAMKTFIELTHERYAETVGEYFGTVIKGMFTDEIGLIGDLPWSPRLPEAFRARNGYDLKDHLHALMDADGEQAAQIRYDYFQTLHLLLRQSYHKQVHDWCEKHGLLYAAEVPSVRMATQRFSHVPGGDSGHEKLGRPLDWILDRYGYSLRYNPKMISSIGNQLARERVMIECFHSVGWSMTLQDMKWMIDRLAAMGINFFVFHAFFYTLDGLTKHDAPPSQFYQNPYWQHFRQLSDYVRRISYAMASGTPVRPIAVLDPTTTFWTHMGNPFHEFKYVGRDEAERLALERFKERWLAICKTLLLHQRDFDHLDPEMLGEAEVRDGLLRIGRAEYAVLVIPPISNLETSAWEKIKLFLRQGGTVIACGTLPYESLDGTDRVAREMAEVFGGIGRDRAERHGTGWKAYVVRDLDDLMGLLDSLLPEEVQLMADGRMPFLLHRRHLEDGSKLVFVSNQEAGEHDVILRWKYPQGVKAGYVYRLCLETGRSELLAAGTGGNECRVSLHFAPYESHLLRLVPEEIGDQAIGDHEDHESAGCRQTPSVRTKREWVWEIDAKAPWLLQPEGDNVLRIDIFELRVAPAGAPLPEKGTRVQAKTFIDQCEDMAGTQVLPLQFRQMFGTPMKMGVKYPIHASYTFSFACEQVPDRCYLLMDQGAISGEWVIRVNGHPVREEQFERVFVYDCMNRRADIGKYVQTGKNTLTVDVIVNRDWDGVVDAIYVTGHFGVRLEGEIPVLTAAPEQAELREGPFEGYPYYAGSFTLKRTVQIHERPGEESFVLRFRDLDPDFHDCLEVKVNGHTLGVRPWTPYEWRGSANLLREGENHLEVKVTNTLIGMLEGQRFDYAAHALQPIGPRLPA